MKKSLCALLLLILFPLGTAQATEFKLTGRTTWQLGQLMVNGMPFVIDDQTRFKDWLNEDDLGGTWVEMKGVVENGVRYVRKVEALDEDDKDEMDLEGPVEGGGSGATPPRITVWRRLKGAGSSWSASLTACV